MPTPRQPNLFSQLALFWLLALGICTQSGCQIFGRFSGATAKPIPVAYNGMPSQQQLLANLRSRSDRVRQLSTSVTAAIPGAPKIKGTLQIEFPNRVRMKAGVMGVSQMGVDIGSNDQEFWVWSKASIPGQAQPALYFADHEAFARSPIRQSMPLEPKWLVDSLGLFEFSPTDAHYGPMDAGEGRMRLYTVTQTPTGRQTRVTLLGAVSGLIEQQAVYDASNQLIAYANSSNYRNYAEQQISLPQRVELHMIQPDGQDVKIAVDFGAFSVGTPGSQVLHGSPERMWTMPNPDGVPKIDLTQVSPVDLRFNPSDPRANHLTQPNSQTRRQSGGYSPAGWKKQPK